MKPTKEKWLLVDEYKTVVCGTNTRKAAQDMMRVYARYVEWNRQTRINVENNESITFENYDMIHIKSVFHYTSKKEFVEKLMLKEFEV